MQIWSYEIKELEKLYESLGGNFPVLERELQSLINTDDENVALLYSRRCLEIIITDLCECELKKSRGTEPLKGIIDKLQKEEMVPSNIIASMHGLNTLATFGTHPKDFDPEQVKPVLNNLLIIVKWYLGYKDPVTFSKLKADDEKYRSGRADIFTKIIHRLRKRSLLVISGLLLAVIITFIALAIFKVIKFDNRLKGEQLIAVLPFTIPDNDTTQEYISYGLVEEILDRLCRIGNLKVISHTSSARFKNSDLSLKEIARELGASAILEGSVQKNGNKLRITAQLIDAKTDTHLWSNKYDNVLSDIFSIYSEVALSVAKELNAVINPEEKALIDKKPTTNTEVWDIYLKGIFYLNQGTEKNFEIAMQYFELAKEKDPEFAPAYAGIARVWNNRKQAAVTTVSEATPKAEAAIQKALELDSTLSDVHQALAGIRTWTRFDWKGGEASFKKAIELKPNNADAHSAYSHLLNIVGRPDEAMKEIEIALELDPLNAKIKAFYGIDLMFVRKYDEAVKAFREALDINPAQGVAEINICNALFLGGRKEEGLEMLKARWKGNEEFLAAIDEGYAKSGFRGAMKMLADIRAEKTKITRLNQTGPAQYYALAGDVDEAVYWFEKAYEERDPNLPYLLLPVYDGLRNDLRFQEIARKMGLPFK
jgi:TolB-like protein/Tfp pilus assembly protein PilF